MLYGYNILQAIHLVLKATEAAKECSMEGSVQVEAVGFRDVFAVYFPAIYFPQVYIRLEKR